MRQEFITKALVLYGPSPRYGSPIDPPVGEGDEIGEAVQLRNPGRRMLGVQAKQSFFRDSFALD